MTPVKNKNQRLELIRGGYADLPALPGVSVTDGLASMNVLCPLCGTTSVALLMGKIRFSIEVGGDSIPNNKELASFVCSNSHLFFLPMEDVAPCQSVTVA